MPKVAFAQTSILKIFCGSNFRPLPPLRLTRISYSAVSAYVATGELRARCPPNLFFTSTLKIWLATCRL